MRTLGIGALVLAACLAVGLSARADIVDPALVARPGPAAYRVHVIDRDAIPGHTIVAVWSHDGTPSSPDSPEIAVPPSASYAVLDDFAHDDLRRVCAFPTARIVPSLGGLGPPMLRDARTGAGGLATGRAEADALLALFDADDVACATLPAPPPPDPALEARHVEAIEDTMRPVRATGRTLELELVSVSFQILGQPPIVVPAGPDHARPTLPPEQHGCACAAAAHRAPPRGALFLAASLALALTRRRIPRIPSPARAGPRSGRGAELRVTRARSRRVTRR